MKKRNTIYRLNIVDYLIFILCSLAAATALFLFYRDLNSYTIKQTEEPVAKIYFKKNTAQRKFIDNDIWEVLTNSSDIYDGDRIRTSKDSEAYTEFNDSGIQIQLREKSMVQIFKNKKQRSVDFIGGEIFVANNSPEEKLVIHSGKKEISVSKSSEVKLALPEVSEAVAAGAEESAEEDNTVVIEVVSGQVEVTESAAKSDSGRQNPEPLLLSAGETVTLVPEVKLPEKTSVEKTEVVKIEESVEEKSIEVEASESKTVETKPLDAKTVEAKPVEVKAVEVKTALPVKLEQMEAGVEKTIANGNVFFQKNVYDRENGKYNYSYGFNLSKVTEEKKTVPPGALIEFTVTGTTNRNVNRIAIQISTGENEWVQAHPFVDSYPNNGMGAKEGEPFVIKTTFAINKPIVSTDNSWVNICYDPDVLDEPMLVRNFEAHVKVLAVSGGDQPQKISRGYKKTLEYKELLLPINKWGDNPGEFDYRISTSTESIFDSLVYLPVGTKIKISVSGKSDWDIDWIHPEIVDRDNDWVQTFLNTNEDDYFQLRFNENEKIGKNQKFSYSKEYELVRPLPNSLNGLFIFIVSGDDITSPPVLKDLKITFEVQ